MSEAELEAKAAGQGEAHRPEPCVVVIFGASGDLSHKELLPSLFSLHRNGLLPMPYAIVGFALNDWDDAAFRREMREAICGRRPCTEKQLDEFESRLFYVPGDFTDEAGGSYAKLADRVGDVKDSFGIPDNVLFHLATPPSFYGTIVQRLHASALIQAQDGWRRVIIEKPFGRDEQAARKLDADLHEVLEEKQIYRVDHFLGKETVQNMLAFRFANPGFEPIWNRDYIDNVQITVAEDGGIRGRGKFYEKNGILRDMVQNHVLQLLCMAAIEAPVKFDAEALRSETNKVLRGIRPVDLQRDVVLGQYGSGTIDGEDVKAYREEENVAEDSRMPTFAALRLYIDNWRWAGVPFYLRTGKRMKRKLTEVTIQFQPTPHLMFPFEGKENLKTNRLTFRLQPDEGIQYQLLGKQPGADLQLCPLNLRFDYARAFGIEEPPSAYEWLIYDAIEGDQTLFPRADWIHRAWSLIDPITSDWEARSAGGFPNYDAGTWGPKGAAELVAQDGRSWHAV